jgi:hypothetical protein
MLNRGTEILGTTVKACIIQPMMVKAGTDDKFQYAGKARVLK